MGPDMAPFMALRPASGIFPPAIVAARATEIAMPEYYGVGQPYPAPSDAANPAEVLEQRTGDIPVVIIDFLAAMV